MSFTCLRVDWWNQIALSVVAATAAKFWSPKTVKCVTDPKRVKQLAWNRAGFVVARVVVHLFAAIGQCCAINCAVASAMAYKSAQLGGTSCNISAATRTIDCATFDFEGFALAVARFFAMLPRLSFRVLLLALR